jgi:outer membrane protein insertion porin family
MRFFRKLCFVLLLPLAGSAAEILDIQVRSRSEGRSVSESTVMAFVGPQVGEEYDPQQVNQDIRRLQATGRYAYVGAELESRPNGLVLVYVVEERPRLRSISIQGASHFSNVKIRDWLELNLSDRVDQQLVMSKLDAVREKYVKDFFTEVSFDVSLTPPDSDNFTRLTIQVDEGERRKVTRIRFKGNTAYSRTQLKRAMGQKQTGLLSIFTGRGKLDENQLRQDMSTLEELYRQKGYLDVNVGPPQVDDEGGGIEITIPIQKFERYTVNSIRVEGNTLYPDSLLGAQVRLQVGGAAESDKIRDGSRRIRDFYNERGFSQTRVDEQVLLSPDKNRVDIVYTVREGQVATVRNVIIRGNTRTKDYVLRRELLVLPGDTLNEVRARKSAARLRNLGFMDNAGYTLLPTDDPDVYDIEFDVTEGRSGQFLAGVGFSSEESLVGFFEVSQGNFDLTDPPLFVGGGEKLQARVQLGTERNDIDVSYARPWFLDRRMTLRLAGFQNERQFLSDDYDQRNTGFNLGLRKGFGSKWRGGFTYTLEEIKVFDVDESAPEIIKIEEGDTFSSKLELSFTRDSRNQVWIPTRGGRVVLNAGFTGGPLGGEVDIYEVGARSSYFYPTIFDHTLNIQTWLRSVEFYGDSDRVPIFDRLFLGGSRSIRGFDFREVSPVDEEGNFVGGQTSLFASVEYTIPLSEMFRYAMFYDWGVVNEEAFEPSTDNANSSYGVGLRIDMPGFPLRLDYSWQVESSEANEDDGGLFSFLIGYSF